MSPENIIGVLMAVLSALVIYAIFVPKSSKRFTPDNEEEASTNPMLKFISSIGDDIYASLPSAFDKVDDNRSSNPRIDSLIVRSGNPWGLTTQEFIAFKYISAFLGFILGWGVWAVVAKVLGMGLPWYIVVFGVTLLCYYIPNTKYNDQAKKRDLEFKRQLPEALDLMGISQAGGVTFASALRDVIPNMQDGVLKAEFTNMTKILDSGGSLKSALDEFASRAPNDGVLTFVRSVQSANEVDAPMGEILDSRAKASRDEFFALVHQKTAQLESKIWMILSPTLLPAVIIIAVAPSASAMFESMG